MERAANPTVLRLHTTAELTGKAIETCPPGFTSRPLCQLPEMPGVRSVAALLPCAAEPDPRRGSGPRRGGGGSRAQRVMGPPVALPPQEAPRSFRWSTVVGGELRRAWRWLAASPCLSPLPGARCGRGHRGRGRCGCGWGSCSSGRGSSGQCGTCWRRSTPVCSRDLPSSRPARLVQPSRRLSETCPAPGAANTGRTPKDLCGDGGLRDQHRAPPAAGSCPPRRRGAGQRPLRSAEAKGTV